MDINIFIITFLSSKNRRLPGIFTWCLLSSYIFSSSVPFRQLHLPVAVNDPRYFLPVAQVTAPSDAIPDDLIQFFLWNAKNGIILQDDITSACAAFSGFDPVHILATDRSDPFQRIDHAADRCHSDPVIFLWSLIKNLFAACAVIFQDDIDQDLPLLCDPASVFF